MPTNQCLWELQKAVFAALDEDVTLSPMVTGVYSHVPQDTAFPYISFGNIQSSDWSTNTTRGLRVSLTIDVFSRYRGSKEALNIIAEIKRILDGAELSMNDCVMVLMRHEGENVFKSFDGLTWEGNVSFSVLVQET